MVLNKYLHFLLLLAPLEKTDHIPNPAYFTVFSFPGGKLFPIILFKGGSVRQYPDVSIGGGYRAKQFGKGSGHQ